ncbi:hypothetical protein [Mycolicibacterium sediminis]|uniref:Uncharacterized protein n=1 Tax=Mycolicibacterium sediminis TaxID=1286180 RepID=A0A7I7QY08_9MYCO|nr:hypothetical protein [Mycolicibacterium sediminis]BBY30897.1 hypothetical protein MSEDJ_49930 [Mycolicibacterium sediminis]
MTTFSAHTPTRVPDTEHDDAVTGQTPINVLSCGRLGRTANPPRFSILDWFRFGRRR